MNKVKSKSLKPRVSKSSMDKARKSVTVERHQTEDPNVTRYVAIDDKGVIAQVRVHVQYGDAVTIPSRTRIRTPKA